MKRKLANLILVIVMCLSVSVTAFAADSMDSGTTPITVNGTDASIWSTVFENNSKYRAATWVQTDNNSAITAGSVKIQSYLVDSSGVLSSSSESVLQSDYYFHVAYTQFRAASDYAYGWGSVWVKNSSGRWMRSDTDDTPRYNLQRSAIVASLTDSLENGNLPRNGAGATYGSMLMKDVTGEIPELIAARGTNGEMGYIKQSDLFADYDAEKRVGRTGRSIPLYDVDGEEIGAFLIRFNDSTEIIGKNIDEVRAELADGRSEDPILWDLAEKSLVNGAYPVNENGETYGHPMLRNLVGYPPDLMAAIGTDGQEGYVRTSDLSHPKFKTPQEALEWQLSQPDSYDIPLCDFQGNEIGSFHIECNTLTISEMEALKAGKAN